MNEWSNGKVIKIEVNDFYFNPKWVTHKGKKMWVADLELFLMMIKQWCTGTKLNPGMKKEEALDLAFEMS